VETGDATAGGSHPFQATVGGSMWVTMTEVIETKRWVGLLEDSHNKVLGHQHHITTYFSN